MNLKQHLFRLGDWLTALGEKHGIRFLTYNPITWARFFFSARISGRVFAETVIQTHPEVKTVCDVGSGSGGYVIRLKQAGFNSCGVEYSAVGRLMGKLQGAKIYRFDCSDSGELPALGKFDLAYSIEVGEHIPEAYARNFVKYITSLSDFVVFSAAFPGQGGQGHINERPQEYWRDLFLLEGFEYLVDQSREFSHRLRENNFRGWLPQNVQLFQLANSENP
jgi:hypothetical protein